MRCVEVKEAVDTDKVKASVKEARAQNKRELLDAGCVRGPLAVPNAPEPLKAVIVCVNQTVVVKRQRQITGTRGRREIQICANGGREVHLKGMPLN